MTPGELFSRCRELALADPPQVYHNRLLHETLVLCCAEALRDSGQAYGNLFSQVDYLCKRSRLSTPNRIAIQAMRRHSNSAEPLSAADLRYDVRALSLLISAAFGVPIPSFLTPLIPTENRPADDSSQIDYRYLRCIVTRCEGPYIYADTDGGEVMIDHTLQEKGADLSYLSTLVREGMQLNLLDCATGPLPTQLRPRLVVVEPDFLVDISAVAACFTDYGHHPLLYTANRLRQRENTQPILLGNYADTALDDLVNHPQEASWTASLSRSFAEQALQFCTCEPFSAQDFTRDAQQRAANLAEVVQLLFSQYDRQKAILEPSFVCERLGLQGRVDLMTTDMRLLVEHKSGKNRHLEAPAAAIGTRPTTASHGLQLESHYVQLLLYYGVLRYNFGVSDARADIRLLYSKYPAQKGLLVVNFYQQLFREAIKFRNQLVATEYFAARQGFGRVLPLLRSAVVYAGQPRDAFFTRYIEPRLTALSSLFGSLTPLERAYYERMMTFIYREQLYAKVGAQEGKSSAIADLWNMPLSEKIETGNIFTGLTVIEAAYDLVTLAVPHQGDDFLPNFRRGDAVYLYAYQGEPDVCRSILYKGTIQLIETHRLTVRLNNGQQNPNIFTPGQTYALEHGSTDMAATSSIRSMQEFISGPSRCRALLLGQCAPQADSTQQPAHPYHPSYDDIILRARRASDYFLLIGPPGTGKTSMALRFLVEDHLAAGHQMLLTAYTNRAVDEICAMLTGAGLDYIRLGHDTACDPRFTSRLLHRLIGSSPRLSQIATLLARVPIVVSTVATLQSRPYIFQIKRFSLAIVDEASQILEPSLAGILTKVDKFILIGDYKQLPAVVQQPEQDSIVDNPLLTAIGLTDCRRSLFQRLVEWESRCGRSQFTGVLRRQGRMHPDIARFPNRMFYFRERLEPVPCPHQLDTALHYDLSPADALDTLLQRSRTIFIDVPRPDLSPHLSDKVNPSEARIVAHLLRRIHRYYGARFCAATTVGVIVPYRNQIAMIRREIDQLGIADLQDVSIDTVERYQGSQRDVIIYSFTVTRPYQLDFLTSSCFQEDGHTIDRRLNVAITRARCQMIATGCAPLLRQNPLFAALIADYENFCPAPDTL